MILLHLVLLIQFPGLNETGTKAFHAEDIRAADQLSLEAFQRVSFLITCPLDLGPASLASQPHKPLPGNKP